MKFFNELLAFLDTGMETPESYGWFHIVFFILSIAAAVLLCMTHRKENPDRVRKIIFWVSFAVFILEIYKQINYTFSYGDAIVADYQWYAFPWQFCSMPMYVGLLVGIFKRGRVYSSLLAFLATYSIFAGICVMIYPNDVFCGTLGINIQTMICHGSMLTLGIYLLYSGEVRLEHKTMLRALPVFATALGLAMLFNEIAYISGLTERETFNMFFVSPHCDPSLPVYSLVQAVVPFPFCTMIYFVAFSLASYVVLLAAMAICKIVGHCKKKEIGA